MANPTMDLPFFLLSYLLLYTSPVGETCIYCLRLQDSRAWRYAVRQPDVASDGRVMADGNAPQDRGVRIDRHVVLDNRVARDVQHIPLFVVLKALGTERHTLIERHMTADDGGLANHDTRTVVDGEILTNLGSWMDINTRLRVSLFRDDTRDDRHFQFVQPMSSP